MRLVFLLCAMCTLYAKGASIIYVHLGKHLPGYYLVSMQQSRLFNPESDIYLLVEGSVAKQIARRVSIPGVHIVNLDRIPRTERHRQYSAMSSHHSKFWRYALERFFFLDDFLQHEPLEDVIHLEGDNLLYRDLDELLPFFHTYYPSIGIPFRNAASCIPGIVYIRTADALASFTSFVLQVYKPHDDDMHLFASFCHATGEGRSLPVLPRRFIDVIGLRKPDIPELYTYGEEGDGSFFDAAALGQLLDGTSPVHTDAGKPHENPDVPFTPSAWKITWSRDEQGRNVPFMQFDAQRYRLNSLHIHSKNLGKFRS